MSDPRTELAHIASALRAYVEWQRDAGTIGFPRGEKRAAKPAEIISPHPNPSPEGRGATSKPESNEPPDPPSSSGSGSEREGNTSSQVAAVPATLTLEERRARLAVLQDEVRACTKCGLATTRTNTVFSRGNPDTKLVFVGEAPGADEDAQGLPFVGRAGQLLDKMIAAMGLSPEKDVYVCNILKCRPPDNRRPTPEEMSLCFPYLHEQLALIKPRVIVALGNTAVSALLDTKIGITKLRGNWKLYRGTTLVMPTYHPSYLIRPSAQQVEAKRQAWEDLQAVMKELGITPPARSK